jgi:hypothetical protein
MRLTRPGGWGAGRDGRRTTPAEWARRRRATRPHGARRHLPRYTPGGSAICARGPASAGDAGATPMSARASGRGARLTFESGPEWPPWPSARRERRIAAASVAVRPNCTIPRRIEDEPRCRHARGTPEVVARPRHARGTDRPRHARGTPEARPRHARGTPEARPRHARGTPEVVARPRHARGTDRPS